MTEREKQRLNELLAKKEAEEKADKEFFKQVKKRKAEVLKVLGVKENEINPYEKAIKEIAKMYGTDVGSLLEHIKSERQISYFKKYRPNVKEEDPSSV